MNKLDEKINEAYKFDTNDVEKCYEVWKPLGMLDKLPSVEIEKKVACEYTKMAKYLLFTDGAYMNSVNVCAFPTVRKIFQDGNPPKENYSQKNVCELLQEVLKDGASVRAQANLMFDIEAKACEVVSEHFKGIKTNNIE